MNVQQSQTFAEQVIALMKKDHTIALVQMDLCSYQMGVSFFLPHVLFCVVVTAFEKKTIIKNVLELSLLHLYFLLSRSPRFLISYSANKSRFYVSSSYFFTPETDHR